MADAMSLSFVGYVFGFLAPPASDNWFRFWGHFFGV
jgi:hypothetical protein